MATNLRTTATVIIIWEDWFDDATHAGTWPGPSGRCCAAESIHPADIRTTHQNVQVVRDGHSSEVHRAIVLWDKVGGGLGLSKAIADNWANTLRPLGDRPTPGQRSERDQLLTATALHRWTT